MSADWSALGAELQTALSAVTHERLDLTGDAIYGEALRRLVERQGHQRRLVTVQEHEAEIEQWRSVNETNAGFAAERARELIHLASEHQRDVDRKAAERLAPLPDLIRGKAERGKLGQQVRRGVLLAADWVEAAIANLREGEGR